MTTEQTLREQLALNRALRSQLFSALDAICQLQAQLDLIQQPQQPETAVECPIPTPT